MAITRATNLGAGFSPHSTYLFVDGANFRRYFDEVTQRWFGQNVDFDFVKIKEFFLAGKAFYYDCIDDVRNENENQTTVDARVEVKEASLNKIREIDGCHVHLGSLSGKGKKKRQKEVDVLLAVQMMEHAVRGNMQKAILLSGDKDFRPLVESLVRLGLFVEVAGDKNHISTELIHSADGHKKLLFSNYYEWVTDETRALKPLDFDLISLNKPLNQFTTHNKFWLEDKGKLKDADVFLYTQSDATYHLVSPDLFGDLIRSGKHKERLKTYIQLEYGLVAWESSR